MSTATRPSLRLSLLLSFVIACGCAADDEPAPQTAAGAAGATRGGPAGGPGTRSNQRGGNAVAVCVGLNAVDPDHYSGWAGELKGCENDARDMAKIARDNGFTGVETVMTRDATRAAVIGKIRAAAGRLRSGDLFMISYSGHGGQTRDHDRQERDGKDETWCLFDGEMLDDELYKELSGFQPGVRVLVFSDSCHSESITKVAPGDFDDDEGQGDANVRDARVRELRQAYREETEDKGLEPEQTRLMPWDVQIATYKKNRQFYEDLDKAQPDEGKGLRTTVLSIAACGDDELAGDGANNGVFTGAVESVWNNGAFQGNHEAFTVQVRAKAKQQRDKQTAMKMVIDQPNPAFEGQRPFTVAAP